MKAICEQCGNEFEPKRSDARFCNSSCRHSFWKKSRIREESEDTFRSQLRGVVRDNNPVVSKTVTTVEFNSEYIQLSKEKQSKSKQLTTLEQQKQQLEQQRNEAMMNPDAVIVGLTTVAGSIIGLSYGISKKEEEGKKILRTLLSGAGGFILGKLYNRLTKAEREKRRKETLEIITKKINEINREQCKIKNEIEAIKTRLSKTPITNTVVREIEETETAENRAGIKEQEKDFVPDRPVKQLPALSKVDPVANNEKIISSAQLIKMQYDTLSFFGKWKEFFGIPSINFHCIIHGKSGEGKSTFAVQFANYLAENFGLVMYISGEEGFSKTMKDKIVNNDAESPNLFIADLHSYQEVINFLKPNKYNFIFIDSLDNMRIGAAELKELRKIYSNSALITISQSTKDGKIRGSNEILHDSDIAVQVSCGIAETTKNRFLEIKKTIDIFDDDIGSSPALLNVVRG
jgi:hypothetical protein